MRFFVDSNPCLCRVQAAAAAAAAMETNALLNLLAPKTPPPSCFFHLSLSATNTRHSLHETLLLPLRPRRRCLLISSATDVPEANNSDTTTPDNVNVKPPPADLMDPNTTPQVKQFRRASRRRRSKQLELENALPKKPDKVKPPPKTWEEMSFSEKAMDLYVGEKGLLFWLNKFAYASIFIMIGAWIVFRFVGPALNLYQLDAPPLSPEAVLKG